MKTVKLYDKAAHLVQKEDVCPHAQDLPGEVHDEDEQKVPQCKRVLVHVTWSETAILQGTLDYAVPGHWTDKEIISSVLEDSARWAEMTIEEPEAKEIEDVTLLSMEVEEIR